MFSIKTYICYVILVFYSIHLSANIDSLNQVLNAQLAESISYQKKIELYKTIGEAYSDENNYDNAISNFEEAFNIAQINKLKPEQEDILLRIGQLYNRKQDYPNSIKTLKKLILESLPTDPRLLSSIYYEISLAYQRLGNDELAYEYQLEALHQNEILKDSSKIARSYYQIGGIFFYQNNLEMAIDSYKKSLKICEELKFQRGIFNCLAAIGGAYSRMDDTENSKKYNQESHEMAKAMNYPTGLAYSTHNLGVNYLALEQLDTALMYLSQSLELKKSANDKWGSVSTLRNIGDVYRLQNKPTESLKYLNEALQVAEELNSKSRIFETYVSLADYHKSFGNFEASTDYLFKSLALKDTLINEATLEKMSDAKTRFEIQEKEEALMKKDKEIANVYNWVIKGSLVVLLVLLWLLYGRYRTQKFHNEALELKNQQIQNQINELALANEIQAKSNRQIKEQNEQLAISNEQLQRFAFIASHDLKEPLRTIGSYSNLLKRRYKHQLDDSANEFLDYIMSGVSRMYHLLNDVLDYSKVSTAEQTTELVNPNEVIEEVKNSLQNQISENGAVFQIGNLPAVIINKSHLHQLFQNLISNAIKFTHKDIVPFVQVNCERKGKRLEFSVSDNGIGLEMAYEQKIFEIFQRLHGKHEYEGTGVGLAICKKILEHYDGEIWVQSTPNKGSSFFFSLPVELEVKEQNEVKSEVTSTVC